MFHHANSLTDAWTASGTTRFASGLPVTLFDNSDNSLLGTLGNGANNYLLDTPQYLPGQAKDQYERLKWASSVQHRAFPRGRNRATRQCKTPNVYGPGINNFDFTLAKSLRLPREKSLQVRAEAFNVFNHAQFYGPASVDGQAKIQTLAVLSARHLLDSCRSPLNSPSRVMG